MFDISMSKYNFSKCFKLNLKKQNIITFRSARNLEAGLAYDLYSKCEWEMFAFNQNE